MVVLQVERDWQWKLESKEQEIASLTARTRQVGESSACGLVGATSLQRSPAPHNYVQNPQTCRAYWQSPTPARHS